jgi:hypothetical protein
MYKRKIIVIGLLVLIIFLLALFLHKKETPHTVDNSFRIFPCVNIIEGKIDDSHGYSAFNSCSGEQLQIKVSLGLSEVENCKQEKYCLLELVYRDLDEESIKPVYFEPQEVGDTSVFVSLIQVLLSNLEYYKGPTNGYFDKETQKALFKYQKDEYILRGGSKKGTLDYLTWNESKGIIQNILIGLRNDDTSGI